MHKSLKQKIQSIELALKNKIGEICEEKVGINWYGAYDIDPKHLVFWVCVQSDRMKSELEQDKPLLMELRALLELFDYPAEARPHVHIGFESQETVDRESNGNWWYHFK